jgi:peroxiredoxin
MKRTSVLVAIVVALVLWILLRPQQASRDAVHQPAPDFSLTDIAGRPLALSSYRGKVVLLDFWATWCEPCKIEIPHFVEMQTRYGTQGLQVIGISLDDDEKPVRDFGQQYKINYPVAIGDAKLAQAYGGVLGLPITFLIDREGRIYKRHIGQTEFSIFEKEVQELLR